MSEDMSSKPLSRLLRMWLLDNETPFSAERTWTRDERGAEFWLVAIRGAFEIDANGRQHVAEKQTEVQRFPIYAGDPVRDEMLSDLDFALSKTGTDVLVGGHACSEKAGRQSGASCT